MRKDGMAISVNKLKNEHFEAFGTLKEERNFALPRCPGCSSMMFEDRMTEEECVLFP